MAEENKDKLKKVLVIAYGFPPAGGSSSIRTVKFCKYLPRFSWKPVVLTVRKPRVLDWDPGLLDDIPKDIDVYRTPSMEPPYFLYNRSNKVTNKSCRFPSKVTRFLGGVFRKIRYAFFIIDERIGWVPFAFLKGLGILRKEKDLNLIYISVKPFSSLFIAILLKKISGLPLVIDFRDAWTDFNPYFWKDKPSYLLRLEAFIEKLAVDTADRVISVNENIVNDFMTKYAYSPASKFDYIPNGFDREDFDGALLPQNKDLFCITYAGNLYAERSPEDFFTALKMLLKDSPDLRKSIRFRYLGRITGANYKFFCDGELKGIIQLEGMLPYRECLRIIRQSNLLLFIEDQVAISDRLLPSKIFEYLASGRPVLALAENGPVKDLVINSASGAVIGHGDVNAIKEKILYFIENGQKTDFNQGHPRNRLINEYSRELAAKKLTDIFNAINNTP
ncbi:MAG: glycosyltransferase [Candidatus Omnitrophota bacterium]|nr:glycosyltransferase [Candidatus Omnitrophota bacterium]